MLKKILTSSAVLVVGVTVTVANAAPYLGASLGVTNHTSNVSSYRGVPLTLSGGYGAVINQNIYLAGEVLGVVGTSTLDNHANGSTAMKTTYGYGVSFIPGLMISDHTLTYARLGLVRDRFSDAHQMATGTQVGLGMQTNVTQHWDLRGEYDYASYSSISGVSSPKADLFNLGLVYKFE